MDVIIYLPDFSGHAPRPEAAKAIQQFELGFQPDEPSMPIWTGVDEFLDRIRPAIDAALDQNNLPQGFKCVTRPTYRGFLQALQNVLTSSPRERA
jgi:hypothetical protein